MSFPLLSALVLVPILSAVVVMLLPKQRSELHMPVALALSLLPLALAGVLFAEFEKRASFQFVEISDWYAPWGMSWHVGVDGISMPLIVLTAILVPISLAASVNITDRVRLFAAMVLFLEACLFGVFISLDLILFFLFFEAILIPMYFIIGIWGSEERIYAAVKFFLYTAFGSAVMLGAIVALGTISSRETGFVTFDYLRLLDVTLTGTEQYWLFAAFAVAFAIKVPIVPFHTWLPDAHVQAPTAGSVLLAGVMLKLGTYGLLRFNLTLFPEASVDAVPIMATLGVMGIVYGAVVAIAQTDLKKLVAYSSVSHLGFIVLGIFALTQGALEGGVIQMINHGLTTGALFLLVGMLYERRQTKKIDDFGGIAKVMPIYAGLFLFSIFASIGLPGLAGFVGEFMILVGSYASLPGYAVVAASGVILAAIYFLWAYERVFTGKITKEENASLSDMNAREISLMVPLVILILVLGLYPKVLLDRISPSTDGVLERIAATTEYEVPESALPLGGGAHE